MDSKIPQIVNHFNIYNDGNKVMGKGDEVTLPKIDAMVATIMTDLGEAEIPVAGKIQKMEQEIVYDTVSKEAVQMYAVGHNANVTLRASQQARLNDGSLVNQGIKVVIKGPCKSFDCGKVKVGEGTACKLVMGVNYLQIMIDNEVLVEIDVFNGVMKINGEDIMADIQALC